MKSRFSIEKARNVAFFACTPRSRAIAEVLRSYGYSVHFASEEGGKPTDEVDLWIADFTNPREVKAAEALREVHARAPLIALVGAGSLDGRGRSLRASETVHFGSARAFHDLMIAVDRLVGDGTVDARFIDTRSYSRSYDADEEGTNQCAYELAAFLTERGVVHAHRIRIVSAVFEAADNARRHGYAGASGTFSVEVLLERARVHVTVEDRGRGFDAVREQVERVPAALPTRGGPERGAPKSTMGGLQRLAALSEELDLHSDERGTRVEMTFELSPVRFEEEPDDFTDVDFLDPDRARELLRALQEGAEEIGDVAPALALTVGRLLGGAQPRLGYP